MLATHGLQHAFTAEHNHLDELFKSYRDWKHVHFAKARAFFEDFAADLQRHLALEEGTVFPLYERKAGTTALTRALRADHERIRGLLGALAGRVERRDTASDAEEQDLLEELLVHDGREECSLYHPLDDLLSEDEKEAVVRSLATAGG